MTNTLYHYIYIIKEYDDLPLNTATSGKVYSEIGAQIDRIILSREYLTYDWVMPMHPYMKDYNPFYDSMTYINIIQNTNVIRTRTTEKAFSFFDFIHELFSWLFNLLMTGSF